MKYLDFTNCTATNTMTTKELLAPLASMEDLSVCMTPMSTPGRVECVKEFLLKRFAT